MDDFNIGKSGLMLSAIVDKFLTTVDEAIVPEALESFINSFGNFWIKRKGKIVPVA